MKRKQYSEIDNF